MTSSKKRSSDQTREESVWQEWLSLYVDACRRTLGPHQLVELAATVRPAVADPESLWRLVDGRTAAEGRFLIAFLAGIDDPSRREALVGETVGRLHRLAAHYQAALPTKLSHG